MNGSVVRSVVQRAAGAAGAIGLTRRVAPWPASLEALLAVVQGLAPTAAAVATKILIDGLVAHNRPHVMYGALLVVLTLLLLSMLSPISIYLRTEINRRIEVSVTDRLSMAVNAIPRVDQFERPVFHDRLRLAQQAGLQAPQQVTTGLVTIIESAVGFVGLTIALSEASLVAAVLAVAAVVPNAVVSILLSSRRAQLEMTLSPGRRRALFYALMQSDPRAAKEIRLFALGDYLRGRLLDVLRKVTATERRRDRAVYRSQLALQACTGMLFAAAVAEVAYGAWTGAASIGDIALTLAALTGIQAGAGTVSATLGQVTNAIVMFENYQRVLGESKALQKEALVHAGAAVAPLHSALVLRDVWFRYADDLPWTLQGIDMVLPAGTSTAIVGFNGAGKSTLMKLLCGLYAPTKGEILWDGANTSELDPTSYRQRFSAVFQDFMSYDLSAADNIAVGDLSRAADVSTIHAAARQAAIHDTLTALPAGYSTFLSRIFVDDGSGEKTASLSGGQWQRVAIARALIRTAADVMVLDEPSSGLDPEAEHALMTTLLQLRQEKTSVLISHRLSTVTDAHSIVVLDRGAIIEQGTHASLMHLGGTYANMFHMQASAYTDQLHDQ